MTGVRSIERLFRAYETIEGAGVRLHRAFGYEEVPLFDPFLMLDDLHAGKRPEEYLAGFPWHPYRGIETVTYMLEGKVEHGECRECQRRRHPVDVCRIGNSPPGGAKAGRWSHGRVPALGQSAEEREDDGPAVPEVKNH